MPNAYDAVENETGGLGKAIDSALNFEHDIRPALGSGQTVSSAETDWVDDTGAPTTLDATVIPDEDGDNTIVSTRINAGGTAGTYSLQATAELSTGETYVINGTLVLQDDDA